MNYVRAFVSEEEAECLRFNQDRAEISELTERNQQLVEAVRHSDHRRQRSRSAERALRAELGEYEARMQGYSGRSRGAEDPMER